MEIKQTGRCAPHSRVRQRALAVGRIIETFNGERWGEHLRDSSLRRAKESRKIVAKLVAGTRVQSTLDESMYGTVEEVINVNCVAVKWDEGAFCKPLRKPSKRNGTPNRFRIVNGVQEVSPYSLRVVEAENDGDR